MERQLDEGFYTDIAPWVNKHLTANGVTKRMIWGNPQKGVDIF